MYPTMLTMDRRRIFNAAAFCVLACILCSSSGCASGLLSTVTSDMKEMLREPAVQATLRDWMANADVTNPEIGFYLVNGGEIATKGIIVRGEMRGNAGTAGIDPELLRVLTEIAKQNGYVPPADTTNPVPSVKAPDAAAPTDDRGAAVSEPLENWAGDGDNSGPLVPATPKRRWADKGPLYQLPPPSRTPAVPDGSAPESTTERHPG